MTMIGIKVEKRGVIQEFEMMTILQLPNGKDGQTEWERKLRDDYSNEWKIEKGGYA